MTSTTTKRFQWIDRDTAARDLLQLVYHAPESISSKALQLLKAIRCPAVIPELQAIVEDTSLNTWQRIYALQVIVSTPGDVYMPQIRTYFSSKSDVYHDQFLVLSCGLADHHPSNRSWLFEYMDELNPQDRSRLIESYSNFIIDDPTFESALYNRFIQLLETNPQLFTFQAAKLLYIRDKRPSTREWLAARWETLVYLCLTAETPELVSFLEDWEELRNLVFYTCPAIVLEYHPACAAVYKWREQRLKSIDLSQSPVWQEFAKLHAEAREGNENALISLERRTHRSDIPTRSAAVHFLGKLLPSPSALHSLMRFVRWTNDIWKQPDEDDRALYETYRPVCFEAGEALRSHPTPEVWQALVNAYFDCQQHHHFIIHWIAYQTDVLSGVKVEYKGPYWKVEDRPWFRALVNAENENA